jgi:hypothetical protein
MRIDNEEAEKQMNNLASGIEWLTNALQRSVQWAGETSAFIFGHKEVLMTVAQINESAAVILAYKPIKSNEDILTIPNVKLIFDNQKGADALIRQINGAKALLGKIKAGGVDDSGSNANAEELR